MRADKIWTIRALMSLPAGAQMHWIDFDPDPRRAALIFRFFVNGSERSGRLPLDRRTSLFFAPPVTKWGGEYPCRYSCEPFAKQRVPLTLNQWWFVI